MTIVIHIVMFHMTEYYCWQTNVYSGIRVDYEMYIKCFGCILEMNSCAEL